MEDTMTADAQGECSTPCYEFHPAATIFPLMTGAEFDELVADIKANGLVLPIVLQQKKDDPDHGKILDGRNRYRACAEAGVELSYVEIEVTDPVAYVISANIRRRHLTSKQKRELIAKLLVTNPNQSDRQIAATTGISHPTVAAVREDLEANRKIFPVEASRGADGKTRKRPSKKTPEQKIVARAVTRARVSERKKKQDAQAGIGPDSSGEVARKLARLEELERENTRLRGENIALKAEVRELKAALALVKAEPAPGENIPDFLRRTAS
jgi:ParB-like chromosome segregation protein Spo0J